MFFSWSSYLCLNQRTSKKCKLFRICMCEHVARHTQSVWFDRLLKEMQKILENTPYFSCLTLNSLIQSHQLACTEHEIMLFSSSCASCYHTLILLPLKQVTKLLLWKCFPLMPLLSEPGKKGMKLEVLPSNFMSVHFKKQCICPNFTTCLGRMFLFCENNVSNTTDCEFYWQLKWILVDARNKGKEKIVTNPNNNVIISRQKEEGCHSLQKTEQLCEHRFPQLAITVLQ